VADRTSGARALTGYEPGHDAATRYPEWVIRHRPLSHGVPEVMCARRRVILIASGSTWPEKRCSLAHAVAHLDLGHHLAPSSMFDKANESAANQLAARRLITLEALADVLCWTRWRAEIAAELQVDLVTLDNRQRHMHMSERGWLRRNVRWMEETA
jgi:hypothetical protein